MGAHVLKLNKVPLVAKITVSINVSRSAGPKPALVPASHFNSNVKLAYVYVCVKFH